MYNVCLCACVCTYLQFFFIPVYHYLDTAAVLLYYYSEVYTSFVNEFRFHALFDGRPSDGARALCNFFLRARNTLCTFFC